MKETILLEHSTTHYGPITSSIHVKRKTKAKMWCQKRPTIPENRRNMALMSGNNGQSCSLEIHFDKVSYYFRITEWLMSCLLSLMIVYILSQTYHFFCL